MLNVSSFVEFSRDPPDKVIISFDENFLKTRDIVSCHKSYTHKCGIYLGAFYLVFDSSSNVAEALSNDRIETDIGILEVPDVFEVTN